VPSLVHEIYSKIGKKNKKQNNGIRISRIIGKWANAFNKYREYTPKFPKNGIITPLLLHLLFSGLLEEANQPYTGLHFPLFFTLELPLGVWYYFSNEQKNRPL